MDAFELLLRASDPEMNLGNEVKDLSFLAKGKSIYDYRDHMTNTMLGKVPFFICQSQFLGSIGNDEFTNKYALTFRSNRLNHDVGGPSMSKESHKKTKRCETAVSGHDETRY